MTPIENFMAQYREETKSVYYLSAKPRCEETGRYVSASYMKKITEPTIISIRYWKYLVMYLLIVCTGAFNVFLFMKESKSPWNLVWGIVLIGLGIYGMWYTLHHKAPEIIVDADRERLIVKRQQFRWEDIVNTYFLVQTSGKSTSTFLLLENREGKIDKISVTNDISRKKMASIIEYYKIRNKGAM